MSYYLKQQRGIPFTSGNGEKEVLKALACAELKNHSASKEVIVSDLKASLTTGKKHSSATLLRRKLKGHLVRELHEI